MSRLRIISLAHRATWSDVICQDAIEKMHALEERSSTSSCWLSLNENSDGKKRRSGIYKISKLKRENYIAAHFVADNEISEEYKCLEKILHEDGCLPDGIDVPIAVPKATKIILIFNLKKGLCYSFYPGALLNFEIIQQCLSDLEKETGIPLRAARLFYYNRDILEKITIVTKSLGYKPYLSKGDFDTVRITAEGDLDSNYDWKAYEESLNDNEKWTTIGYRRSTNHFDDLFRLYNRKKSSDIALPGTEELGYDDLVDRILNIQLIFENAVGKEICDYCFPEPITTLSQFDI
ncbi:MAG TPA: hypothetical protein VE573_19490 [Nitrososphaeraceae archaeon]|nr:hypothetical protein [Nitrososphaeraceae archaeon]